VKFASYGGPYWINYVGDEIHVCGRHGKIIQRYPAATGEVDARAHLSDLIGGMPTREAPPPPEPTKAQRELLARAREGIQYRAPTLAGVFAQCAEKGWIVADPEDYGLHVTLTAEGLKVA
jgi:hypothetical protein